MQSIALIAAFVLLVQGAWTWMQHRAEQHIRAFGILTMLLAVFGFFGYYQFVYGPFILSRELGYVLAHGEWARAWIGIFLFGCSLIAGLAWRVAYLETSRVVGFPRFMVVSVAIALLSIWFIEPVESGLNAELNLYSYDVWWPPLAIWVAICLVSTMLSALRLTSGAVVTNGKIDVGYLCGIALAISVLAFIAIYQRTEVFDDSLALWEKVLLIMAPTGLWSACYLAARPLLERRPVVRVLFSIACVIPAAFLAWLAVGDSSQALYLMTIWAFPIAVSMVVLAFRSKTFFEVAGHHLPREGIRFQVASDDWALGYGEPMSLAPDSPIVLGRGRFGRDAILEVPPEGGRYRFLLRPEGTQSPPDRIRLSLGEAGDDVEPVEVGSERFGTDLYLRSSIDGWAAERRFVPIGDGRWVLTADFPSTLVDRKSLAVAVLIVIIAISLAVMFLGLSHIGAAIAIGTFFLSWTVLSDLLWRDGILAKIASLLTDPAKLRSVFAAAVRFFGTVIGGVTSWLGSVFSGDKFWQVALKVIAAVALLIALAELPSAGKTIVNPFDVNSYAAPTVAPLASDDADRDALGGLVTDLVVQELRSISEKLAREATLNPQSQSGSGGGNAFSQVYFYDTGKADQALAESGSIDLPGGVKLPMQLLLWPIQQPMRYFLDIDVVSGSVIRVDSALALIASSRKGGSWRVDAAAPGEDPQDQAVIIGPPTEQEDDETGDDAADVAAPADTDTDADEMPVSARRLPLLAQKLAFEIVADSHPGFDNGLSRDWDAYQEYSLGLDAFVKAQESRSFDSQILFDLPRLREAIGRFEAATEIDPAFGWAHYFLGLAYQEYGQNLKAQDAFERSLAVSPGLAPARVALAYHLLAMSSMDGSNVQWSGLYRSPSTVQFAADASRLWQAVIDDTSVGWQHRASAFTGLADMDFRILTGQLNVTTESVDDKAMLLSGYYLAKRAVRAYERYRPAIDANDGLRLAHANALNLVGVLLDSVSYEPVDIESASWTCIEGEKEASSVNSGRYTAQAARYYRRALEANPNDPVIQCNLAYARLGIGEPEGMEAISAVAAVRRYTGDRIQVPADEDISVRTESLYRKLNEYRMAFEADRADLMARNSAAYAYYTYRTVHPQVENQAEWLLTTGLWAEEVIREAIRLAEVLDRPEVDVYRSTLAEVLLALQRPEAALPVLVGLDESLPKHRNFREPRLDLAQTYLCLATREGDPSGYLLEAKDVMSRLREADTEWDVREHQYSIDSVDLRTHLLVCSPEPPYSLFNSDAIEVAYSATRQHMADDTCDRNDVQVTVPAEGDFQVRIWGYDGFRETLYLSDGSVDFATVSWEARDSTDEYYTRLYEADADGNYVPASEVETISTYGDCSRNLSLLYFNPVDGP